MVPNEDDDGQQHGNMRGGRASGWLYPAASFPLYHENLVDRRQFEKKVFASRKRVSPPPAARSRGEEMRLDEKKRLKRAANRRSACTSRVRKKQFVEETTQANHRLYKYAKILAAAPPTITLDERGMVRFASWSCLKLLNLESEQELLGTHLGTHFDRDTVLKLWLHTVNAELDTSNEDDRQQNIFEAAQPEVRREEITRNTENHVVTSSEEDGCGTTSEREEEDDEDDDDDLSPPPHKRSKIDRTRLGSGGGLRNLNARAIFKVKSNGTKLLVACGGSFAGRRQLSDSSAKQDASSGGQSQTHEDDVGAARELVLSLRPLKENQSDTCITRQDSSYDSLLGMTCSLQPPIISDTRQRAVSVSKPTSPQSITTPSTTGTTLHEAGFCVQKHHFTAPPALQEPPPYAFNDSFAPPLPQPPPPPQMLYFTGEGHLHHSDYHARSHNKNMSQLHSFLHTLNYTNDHTPPPIRQPSSTEMNHSFAQHHPVAPPLLHLSTTPPILPYLPETKKVVSPTTRPQPRRIEHLCSAKNTPSDVQNAVESLMLISRRDSSTGMNP